MKKSLVILTVVLFFSCNKDRTNLETQKISIDRNTFIESNDVLKQKEIYQDLDFIKKRDLWISKLAQVYNTEISKQNKKLIKELIEILQNTSMICDIKDNSRLEEIAVELAEIIPKEEYVKMFVRLENYKAIKFDKPPLSESMSFALQIRSDFESDKVRAKTIGKNKLKNSAKCNCKWTCGMGTSKCTHTDCEETEDGCGFLWMSPCEARDEAYPCDN